MAGAKHESWVQLGSEHTQARLQRIMVVGERSNETVSKVSDHLARSGSSVDLCNVLDSSLNSVAQTWRIWQCVIVHIEVEHDLEEITECLMEFRAGTPNVPLVLIGASLGQNVLSTERSAIADLYLQDPVRLGWFRSNLRVAKENNLQWNELAKF